MTKASSTGSVTALHQPPADGLIEPHGGRLVGLVGDDAEALRAEAVGLPSITLGERHLLDLELLMNGGFSPLRGFMTREVYEGVVETMRLPDGLLWPMPITLDVADEVAATLKPGDRLGLRDGQGFLLALLAIEDIWRPDRAREAERVFGTNDPAHPGVHYLLKRSAATYVGGRVLGVMAPRHYDFLELRRTPAELRRAFAESGWRHVVAFQTRSPIHRAHFEMTMRAMVDTGSALLLHPVAGVTRPGDVDHFTRVRCYQALMNHYPAGRATLSLLSLAMRMGGPREALWHAIIRKNFGASHFIVGRDHAGPGRDSRGRPFYGAYDALELVRAHAGELGVELVPFRRMVYAPARKAYVPEDELPAGSDALDISGPELRSRLEMGQEVPEWFSFPAVIDALRDSAPARVDKGLTVFFTGLSGAGKSTLANALMLSLMEKGRRVTLLDGDEVRGHLSTELGFSREHRDLNIRRIAFVAKEITKHRGIALCAPIAPYAESRDYARRIIGEVGGFVEIHVSTPLSVCEARDPKGLYARARAGIVEHVTGIADPYEEPESPELRIDTTSVAVEDSVRRIIAYLTEQGYLA